MISLRWFEVFPPRELSLDRLTGLVRVLSGRPRLGLRQLQPVVVFEAWLSRDDVRWLVGCDETIARHLPGELAAQVTRLSVTAVTTSPRTMPITAREVAPSHLAFPLRLDTAGAIATGVYQSRRRLGAQEAVVLQWVVGPSHDRRQRPAKWTALESLGVVAPREPDSREQAAWREKTTEPLYGIRGRVGAVAADPKRGAQIIGPIVSALSMAASAHTSLSASRQSKRIAEQLFQVIGKPRTWSGMVNAAELAALLAWPVEGVHAPGADSAFDAPPRGLLVPPDRPEQEQTDRVLGVSTDRRSRGKLVWFPTPSIASHVHVIAPTGAGKSTTLARWLISDIAAGRSVFMVEPKGDLVTDVLARIPAQLVDRVHVIEPGTPGPVVSFNPLRGPLEDAERRADSLLNLFKELFGTAIGPRSSDVLLHALIALCRLDDGALTDIPAFLTNSGFRRHVLTTVSDPLTLAPWAAWFEGLSDVERLHIVAPILNKTRVFTARPVVRRLLSHAASRLSLDDLFREPTVILVNLNAGILGTQTVRLIGSLLLGQLREAVQRQTVVPIASRRPVSVVVDEWQQFTAGMDFADMLATARGMQVGFTLAHQHLAQLSPTLRAAVLANTRSRLAYRPAEADAKTLAAVLGCSPDELMQLPAHHAATQVLVDGATSSPFVVETPPLPDASQDPVAIRQLCVTRDGSDAAQLDAEQLARWQSTGNQGGSIGTKKRGTVL